MDTQTQQWLQQAKQSGMTDEQIRQQLLQGGWEAGDIAVALGSFQQKIVPTQPGFTPTPGVEYTPGNYTIGKQIFRRAFAASKSAFKYYIGFAIFGIGFSILNAFVLQPAVAGNALGTLGITFLGWVILAFMSYATTIIIATQPQSFNDVLSKTFEKFIPLLLASILSGLVITGGFVLLFVPGILMAIAFSMLPFVVAKENFRGMNALQRCYALVRGFRGNMLGAYAMLSIALFGIFIVVAVIALIIGILVGNSTSGNTGFIAGFTAGITPFLMLYIILPLFYSAFGYTLYTDLVTIRPIGSDPEIEAKGRKRSFIYLGIGIIGAVMMIFSFVSLYKSIKPVTEQQYVSINAELACYMYNNGFMNTQISQLDTEARIVKNQEAALKVPTEVQKLLTRYGVTELGIQNFESSQNANEASTLIQQITNKASQDCGYVDEENN